MNQIVADILLHPYYYGTLPIRWRLNARRKARGECPIMAMFYHRVADDFPSCWTISTKRFAQQIQWLRRHYPIISLHEAQHCIAGKLNTRPVVSITFDDGYADNNAFALPMLIRLKVPFTYFVAVDHVTSGASFTHDVAAGHRHRINTPDELRVLANAGVEIGLHTRTHADLGRVYDYGQLYDEVVTAGRELAQIVGRPIRYFAFPYGLQTNMTAEAFYVARQAGYLGVCSAYGGYNFPGDDPFHIQRFHADPAWIRWKNYVTVDPRKIRKTERFDDTLDQATAEAISRSAEQQQEIPCCVE